MSSFATIGRIADAPNASQGFKRHCALAAIAKREPMSFQAFLKRHGKNWPSNVAAAPVAVEDGLQAQIAALQAQLDALTAAPVATVEAPSAEFGVGTRFAYTRKDGSTTEREIVAVNKDGSLTVRNLEYGVVSKRAWRGLDRQIAKGSSVIL